MKLPGTLKGVVLEPVESHLRILADLDEVAVRITHVAAPFPAAIVQRLGKKERSFVAPLFVASPDVSDTQVEKAIHSIEIRRSIEENFWLVGSRATAGIENDPGIRQ